MTDATTSFPPLVVGTDPVAVKRAFRLPIILHVVMAVLTAAVAVAVAIGVTNSSGDVALALAWAGFVLLWPAYFVFMAVYITRMAQRRASLGSVLTLDDAGMEWRMAQGTIFLSWPLVASLSARSRSRFRILTYRLADGVTPATPGVRSDLTPKLFRTMTKRGLQIGSAGIDVHIDTIVAATAAFTQNRLTPR